MTLNERFNADFLGNEVNEVNEDNNEVIVNENNNNNAQGLFYCCGICNVLFEMKELILHSMSLVSTYIYDHSRYYEIRISIIGMKNSGKTTFVEILKEIENKPHVNKKKIDTVPTLTMRSFNITLKRPQLQKYQRRSNVTTVSVNEINQKDINIDNELNEHEDNINEEQNSNSLDILGNYIRSMRGTTGGVESNSKLKSIQASTKSNKSFVSTKTNYSERTPLLNLNNTEEIQKSKKDKVNVKIYDLSGQMKFSYLWKEQMISKNSDCMIYIIDLSDTLTMYESRKEVWELLKFNNTHDKLPFIIIGNKSDLVDWNKGFAEVSKINNGYKNSNGNKIGTGTGNGKDSHGKIEKGKLSNKVLFDNSKNFSEKSRQVIRWLGLSTNLNDETISLHDGVSHEEIMFEMNIFVTCLCSGDSTGNQQQVQQVQEVVEWALGAAAE